MVAHCNNLDEKQAFIIDENRPLFCGTDGIVLHELINLFYFCGG